MVELDVLSGVLVVVLLTVEVVVEIEVVLEIDVVEVFEVEELVVAKVKRVMAPPGQISPTVHPRGAL